MSKISSNHEITLPVESLERAGLRPGDEVAIEAQGPGRIVVRRVPRDPGTAVEVAVSDRARRIERGSLTIWSESGGDAHRIALEGEMDGSNARDLEQELVRLEATDVSRIVLDLSRLKFIDSTGLAVILRVHGRAKADGHSLCLVRPRGQVGRALELSALDQELSFLD
jgi:anti-anti-sigma factor